MSPSVWIYLNKSEIKLFEFIENVVWSTFVVFLNSVLLWHHIHGMKYPDPLTGGGTYIDHWLKRHNNKGKKFKLYFMVIQLHVAGKRKMELKYGMSFMGISQQLIMEFLLIELNIWFIEFVQMKWKGYNQK